MVYNGYYKVMSNIPKMGHLPIPAIQYMEYFLPVVLMGRLNQFSAASVKEDNRFGRWEYLKPRDDGGAKFTVKNEVNSV